MLHTNRTQKEQAEPTLAATFEAGDMEYSYCADTDTMPLPCDHLVDNRNTLSGGGVLVLAFAAILALMPTV